MKKRQDRTIPILIDIKYKLHRNHFEEVFGDNVPYSRIEQESYLELKEMCFSMISPKIKFRKFCRDNGALTIKADMTQTEYETFLQIKENTDKNKKSKDMFSFVFNFFISDVNIMTKSDVDRNKKAKLSDEEYQFLKETETEDEESDEEEDEEIEDEF